MLPTSEEQKIADLATEKRELLELLSAAFSDLNLYWRNDFGNRGLATAMRDMLTRHGFEPK